MVGKQGNAWAPEQIIFGRCVAFEALVTFSYKYTILPPWEDREQWDLWTAVLVIPSFRQVFMTNWQSIHIVILKTRISKLLS